MKKRKKNEREIEREREDKEVDKVLCGERREKGKARVIDLLFCERLKIMRRFF